MADKTFQPVNVVKINNKYYIPNYSTNKLRIYTDLTNNIFTEVGDFKFNQKSHTYIGMDTITTTTGSGEDIVSTTYLLISDPYNNQIQVYNTTDDSFVKSFGKGYLDTPCGIAVDSDNNIHIYNRNTKKIMVLKFSDTSYVTEYGNNLLGASRISNIGSDTIYVAETDKNRIVSFTKDTLSDVWAPSTTYVVKQFEYTKGINNMKVAITDCVIDFILKDNNLYVIDTYGSKVVKWSGTSYNTSEIVFDAGNDTSTVTKVKYPKSLTDSSTLFYLADLGHNRILNKTY